MSEDIVPSEDSNLEAEELKTEEQQIEEPKVEEPKAEPVVEPKEARPVHTIPLSKYNEDKEKAANKARELAIQEKDREIAELKAQHEARLAELNTDPLDQELDRIAEEHNLDKAAAKALIGVVRKAIPTPDTSKFDQLLKEQEIKALRDKVSTDFDATVAPLILKDFPQATPEHIRGVKERIEELAFSEGFNTYRLADIYTVKKSDFEFKNGYSAESSTGRNNQMIDFSKITDEQEIELAEKDPEAYRAFLKWQEGQGSKYID